MVQLWLLRHAPTIVSFSIRQDRPHLSTTEHSLGHERWNESIDHRAEPCGPDEPSRERSQPVQVRARLSVVGCHGECQSQSRRLIALRDRSMLSRRQQSLLMAAESRRHQLTTQPLHVSERSGIVLVGALRVSRREREEFPLPSCQQHDAPRPTCRRRPAGRVRSARRAFRIRTLSSERTRCRGVDRWAGCSQGRPGAAAARQPRRARPHGWQIVRVRSLVVLVVRLPIA